jgi:hypothetical protein
MWLVLLDYVSGCSPFQGVERVRALTKSNQECAYTKVQSLLTKRFTQNIRMRTLCIIHLNKFPPLHSIRICLI